MIYCLNYIPGVNVPKSYKPTALIARIAKRTLNIRAKQPSSNKAGTPVGIRRAVQLANRQPLSLNTIKRMNSFFARHSKMPGAAKARLSSNSKAAQAWGLWGGTPGRIWAKKILRDQKK